MKIRGENGICATLNYSGSTVESGTRSRKVIWNALVWQLKMKIDKTFFQITQGLIELFVISGLRVIPCLSALNVRTAGATLYQMANAEVYPVSQTSETPLNRQKSRVEKTKNS